jgi:hypothetical protein
VVASAGALRSVVPVVPQSIAALTIAKGAQVGGRSLCTSGQPYPLGSPRPASCIRSVGPVAQPPSLRCFRRVTFRGWSFPEGDRDA